MQNTLGENFHFENTNRFLTGDVNNILNSKPTAHLLFHLLQSTQIISHARYHNDTLSQEPTAPNIKQNLECSHVLTYKNNIVKHIVEKGRQYTTLQPDCTQKLKERMVITVPLNAINIFQAC